LYDPPEYKSGKGSTAGDIWGLGITLVEALTQSPPEWSRGNSEIISLPANLAPEFFDTVQRCLNRDPNRRPAVAELVAQFSQPAPEAPPAVPPLINEPMVRTLATQNSPRTRRLIAWITAAVIALWAVWVVVHLFHSRASVQPAASIAPQSPPAWAPPAVSPPAVSPPAVSPPPASSPTVAEIPKERTAAPLPTVLHQEIPDLSRSARGSIRGVIKIAVRVTVDRSGNVVAAALNSRGSSKYFGRAAIDAAKKWKFAPAADQPSRIWVLHFDLTRAGTTADAAAER
jgi:TonB family protein